MSIRNSMSLLLLGAASLALSGCMTSPNDGEYIGAYDTPIPVEGFTLDPDELVLVEVLDPATSNWVIISADYTSLEPVTYDGIEWYSWQVSNLSIPRRYWWGYHILSCQLRARIYGHTQPLSTFTDWDPGMLDSLTLSELWNEFGAGDTVRIYGGRGPSQQVPSSSFSLYRSR